MREPDQQSEIPRGRNADATRADLLRAAVRRFAVMGYDRTRLRDIATDVGVNVSLINRYFGSKDGLLAEVMRESANTFEDMPAGEGDDLLDSLVTKLDEDWPEYGGEHPLLLLLRDVGDDDRVGALRRRSLEVLVSRLGGQGGSVADGGGVDQLSAELMVALIAGVLTLRSTMPESALTTTDPEELQARLKAIGGFVLGT